MPMMIKVSSRNYRRHVIGLMLVAFLFLFLVSWADDPCNSSEDLTTTKCLCPEGSTGPSCTHSIDETQRGPIEKETNEVPCNLTCEEGSHCVIEENGDQSCQCTLGTPCTRQHPLEMKEAECDPPCPDNAICQRVDETGVLGCSFPPNSLEVTLNDSMTVASGERRLESSQSMGLECSLPCKEGTICIAQQNGIMACQKQIDQSIRSLTATNSPSTSPSSSTSDSSSTACSLQCTHGETCTLDPTGQIPTCSCRPGFTGDLCEAIIEKPCGPNTCYHGSLCVVGSDGALSCDCRTINDPTRHYGGKFCQFDSTLYCSNPAYFCFNGGRCKDEGLGKYSCLCPLEWTGTSCETERPETPSDGSDIIQGNQCNMTCFHGGRCHKGEVVVPTGSSQDITTVPTGASEHCVCPEGYTGPQCEHSYKVCGNGEHMCLHGSVCVPPKDGNHRWTCECHDTSGNTCNRHISRECTTLDSHKSVYSGMDSLILCVNDGVCTSFTQDGRTYPACKCPPRYTGPHCEFLKEGYDDSTIATTRSHGSVLGIIVGLLVSGAVIIFVVLMMNRQRRRRRLNRQKTSMIEFAHINEQVETSPSMEELDFEDENMEEVELL